MDDKNHTFGECPICFEDLNENIAVTACFHKFHFKCISEWSETNIKKNKISTCPCCKRYLQVVNVYKPNTNKKNIIPKKIESSKIMDTNLNNGRVKKSECIIC